MTVRPTDMNTTSLRCNSIQHVIDRATGLRFNDYLVVAVRPNGVILQDTKGVFFTVEVATV